VVRRERKGRGGKTATLVEGVALQGAALEAFGREMRQSLGTGGSIEDNTIVISGDQVERAMAWLRARGATRLVAGN
jgi:translation initiation factor 1